MEFVFIRHGRTGGNLQSRYIGSTDEELCKEGINGLKDNLYRNIYPKAGIVFYQPDEKVYTDSRYNLSR